MSEITNIDDVNDELKKLLFKGIRPQTLKNLIWMGFWLTRLEPTHPLRVRIHSSLKENGYHISTANFMEALRAEDLVEAFNLSQRTAHDYLAALRTLSSLVF